MLRIQVNKCLQGFTAVRRISNVPVAFSRDIVKLPDKPESEQENLITKRLKSTADAEEVLEIMSTTRKADIEPHQLAFALTRLFELQKAANLHPKEITSHAGFNNACHLLKFKAPRMETNDVITSLKVMSSLGINSNSVIMQRLLHVVKSQINDFTPGNLMFLNFLLSKMTPTPLIEALQIAIPVVFNLNLSLKIDHENPKELAALLQFVGNSTIKLTTKSMTNIVTALTLHGDQMDLQDAKSVVWSLVSMSDDSDRSHERLFSNCMKVLNKSYREMSFVDMETTVSKLISRIQSNESIFYNEEFFNNSAKYVIENDCGYLLASYIQKKFNNINFVSFELLDYLDETIVKNHSNLSSCRAAGLLTITDGFSNANYKSENWEILKTLIHENPLMNIDQRKLPWLRLALNLVSLGFHSNILIEDIFKTKFLNNYLTSQFKYIDYAQLLLLWQAVTLLVPDYNGAKLDQSFIDDATLVNAKRPNEMYLKILSNIYGGREFIQTNVTSSHGHCLEFVISFDCNGNPIAMPCVIKKYEELPKSQVNSIAVFFNGRNCYAINYPERLRAVFDLRRRTIEALGIKAVNISQQLWHNLPESERETYLDREIRYALNH